MVHSQRFNVQKVHIGGTPRKVLYHCESRLVLVMRTDLSNDTCLSDICCVDPQSGTVLSTFKLEPDEIAKSMELVKVGNEHVVVIGTSLSSGPAIMPSGEAERCMIFPMSYANVYLVLRFELLSRNDKNKLHFINFNLINFVLHLHIFIGIIGVSYTVQKADLLSFTLSKFETLMVLQWHSVRRQAHLLNALHPFVR